ncbi:glycoside hydrolase family 2 TIM barrel-domain containing protein [Paenibacillus sp. JDR-2]|uniref:glycoside hydrolase family 2 TIM barrel-domain containing protein n=1 Tax=Paenibacillus sp. (strain JDR-2) TaxID=324057 RepID=UPI0001AAF8C8|nr:glycoside hydrolase family 2 TIM barrel-domain containing protein [Paenibacillus sp. JDR-2]ACT01178.1 glycoside hydrolase family 2 sugar binding [Paenibacillus sp. JDR-2]
MSQKQKLNNDWFFSKHPLGTELDAILQGGIDWSPITLPHDWLIYDSNNLYENSIGWYRKAIRFEDLPANKKFALRFEGVYMNSTVYVNGRVAGTWKNGYSTFEFDITSLLTRGENEILVQVIHESPNSRWYSGAGIYRPVWLITSPDTRIASDGIYISAKKNTSGTWSVDIDTEVVFANLTDSSGIKLRHTILDAAATVISQSEALIQPESGSTAAFNQVLAVQQPRLWDLDEPSLYKLQTELIVEGNVLDSEEQNFGFRTFDFDTEKGFFLNGRPVKLQGVCQHHDLGSLGAAVNKTALRRQIALLQEMGVNAIRTAHNMPAVELMELADEMGVLIVSEAYDMWERAKTPYDFARFYKDWWKKDIASWVRRDRNHPSMLMWSIGNEIYDTHADERGQTLTVELRDKVHFHDPKGNAVVTIGSNYMPWENAQKCADLVQFAGYNYGDKYYKQHHEEHPDWYIYGSETCSTVQSRGIYHFPLAQSVLADDDEQCSSLGNSSTSWGAKSTEACIIADRDAAFSLGQFLWTGFDYIGEPTPYHTKNSYFGQIDTAGFKKDAFYIYQAEWTDYRVKPMVHIFPYWDFSEGQLIDVRVSSNAPKIELFFNDNSLGTYDIDHVHGQKLLGEWQIPYTKGILRAVAYDESGNVIATDIQSSFGDAETVLLTPDKTAIAADGSDLVFIEISALDRNNLPVANANNRIHVTVEGPGRLVGLDNGDSADYDSYKGTNRRMFSGKLLAVIAPTLESGTITVRAVSNGLAAGEVTLTAVAPEPSTPGNENTLYAYAPGQAAETSSGSAASDDEIPVRKLEIICPQGNALSAENRALPVQVVIHPSQATYRDVEWRVTNAAGVDANIATLEADGHHAAVNALSDGEFYIRCATKNGADNIRLYSLMEFRTDGVGQAFINPYEFVSAGYHSESSRNLTNGNERGVATSRDGESWICFDNIDFGSYGADEITLPIFSLDSERFTIDLWEGIPGEPSASLLAQITYQKPTKWNVYQEETYRLPRRLTGITSLSFVLQRKIHLSGFQYKKAIKAFERLEALENNQIYGDTYTLTDQTIENIGNNVSLVFRDMDFGDTGTSKLAICGQSPIDNNTIHILFSGADGETKQLVEFAYTEDYCEKEYALERITGLQTVTFMFLPGSQFNFKSFQFLPE